MKRPPVSTRRERGAALTEAAFVTPVFFALIFGIFEIGLLFRNSLTTSNATVQGARAASVHGNAVDTDYLVIRSIEHGLQAMALEDLEMVVIFRADGPNATVPAQCLIASQNYDATNPTSPACNRYEPADFFKEIVNPVTGIPTGNFGCGPASIDRYWCPDDREVSLSAGTDYLGIYIETNHHFITGFFQDGRPLTETKIVRLEPDGN